MNESERLQRYRRECTLECADDNDLKFSDRIAALLNHPQIDKYCMIDAYYYDFSVIPRGIQERLNLWRDTYFIFGITIEGEIVSKWVDRWALDSNDEIVNGEVIKNDKTLNISVPKITQSFNKDLLSTPCFDLFKGELPK
jgi:hypothetical protein